MSGRSLLEPGSKRLADLIRLCLYLAPPTGAVVGDDGLEEVHEGALVDDIALADLDRSRGQVPVALVDDALGIGRDGVVDEHVDVVLGPEQRADVAVQGEVRLPGPLDGLDDVRVGGVHQGSHPTTDVLLPAREGLDVRVDPGVDPVSAHGSTIPRDPAPLLYGCPWWRTVFAGPLDLRGRCSMFVNVGGF